MKLMLAILAAISLLEGFLWLPPLWRFRRWVAGVLVLVVAVGTGYLLGAYAGVLSVLAASVSVYRVVNLLRLVENRMSEDYLRYATRRTAWMLITGQLAIGALAVLQHHRHTDARLWWTVFLGVQLACGLVLAASTRRHLRTTRPPVITETYSDRELPTLTVAIPARNETDDIEACLRSLVACDYPKLEVLVLDDCSQERHTPEIIRGFAHDGVQFIAGEIPPPRWLAKNYAYEQLAAAANGELLLFCGVDVRFEPGSLRCLVTTLLYKKKTMLSVLPRNQWPAAGGLSALLIQPCRYAWELALPRRFFNRPPVLSTCWLIKRSLLEQAGGFRAVSHSISPESYFARQATHHEDGYSFMQSTSSIGLDCVKSLDEQRATAIRTRYPQLHRRPELVALLTLTELGVLITPFGLVIAALIAQAWLMVGVAVISCVLLLGFYGVLVNFTYRQTTLAGFGLLPVAALFDIILLNYSMWQYEFREVDWKGRNVCVPVMRAVEALPQVN